MRVLPKSFLALTYFFNDLNDYSHHRTVYPEAMQAFMDKSVLFDQIKVQAWLVDSFGNVTDKLNEKTGGFEVQNSFYVRYMKLDSRTDPDKAYFLSSSINIFVKLLQYLCYFSILKLLHLILYFLRFQHSIFSFIY